MCFACRRFQFQAVESPVKGPQEVSVGKDLSLPVNAHYVEVTGKWSGTDNCMNLYHAHPIKCIFWQNHSSSFSDTLPPNTPIILHLNVMQTNLLTISSHWWTATATCVPKGLVNTSTSPGTALSGLQTRHTHIHMWLFLKHRTTTEYIQLFSKLTLT